MKITEGFKCPFCKEMNYRTFHDNTRYMQCEKCDKYMDIRLEIKVEVITSIPARKCIICGEIFTTDKIDMYGRTECPECLTTNHND
ncbi:MAG: hypothetical protein ACRC18_06705 [Cetobacterium sp.]